MKKLMTVTILAATCFAVPSFAATDAECDTMWKNANKSGGAVLTDAESMRYSAAMRVREYKNMPADGKVSREVFIDACKADIYMARKSDEGAPLKGANSFTEGQAKDRATAHGFMNVGDLKKDDNGVWRGSAMWDGKPSQVAVDYKGNVVAQPAQ